MRIRIFERHIGYFIFNSCECRLLLKNKTQFINQKQTKTVYDNKKVQCAFWPLIYAVCCACFVKIYILDTEREYSNECTRNRMSS